MYTYLPAVQPHSCGPCPLLHCLQDLQKAGCGPVNEANYSVFVDSCCNQHFIARTTFLFVPTGIFMCLTTSSVSNILQYSMQVCRATHIETHKYHALCHSQDTSWMCPFKYHLCTPNNFAKKRAEVDTEYRRLGSVSNHHLQVPYEYKYL